MLLGPRWRRTPTRVTEVSHDDKPVVLRQYLRRWHWQVKGFMSGVTPDSGDDELRSAAPAIPVFSLG